MEMTPGIATVMAMGMTEAEVQEQRAREWDESIIRLLVRRGVPWYVAAAHVQEEFGGVVVARPILEAA